jgi:hypothetical protein
MSKTRSAEGSPKKMYSEYVRDFNEAIQIFEEKVEELVRESVDEIIEKARVLLKEKLAAGAALTEDDVTAATCEAIEDIIGIDFEELPKFDTDNFCDVTGSVTNAEVIPVLDEEFGI